MHQKIEEIYIKIISCFLSSLIVYVGGEITVETSGLDFTYVNDQEVILAGKTSITIKIQAPRDGWLRLSPTNNTEGNFYEFGIGKCHFYLFYPKNLNL